MMYAYPYTLACRAIVATLDLTAGNLHLLRTNHWLKESKNVCLVHLTTPAWHLSGEEGFGSTIPSRQGVFEKWTVAELGEFLRQQDALGLAAMLQSSSVTGADLLGFASWSDLATEFAMIPFAAKRVMRLRDEFLAGRARVL